MTRVCLMRDGENAWLPWRPDMRVRLIRLVTALVATACAAATAGGVGMRVSPGGALIQGVAPGQKAELSTPITILNDDTQPHTVTIAARKPSEETMKVPVGYSEIPDPSWVSFSEQEVNVPAKGQAAVKMSVSVPEGAQYCNQHWSVAVAVRSKPVPGQMITLGLYPRFEIETAPSRPRGTLLKGPVAPLGDLVLSPSMESIEGLAPGGKPQRVELTLWNNSDKPFRGDARVLAVGKKERIDISGGWTWLPDASWVKVRRPAMEVGARRSTEVVLDVAVPEGKQFEGRAWEAVVLVQGGDGPAALARIRVKTTAAASGQPQK